MSKVAAFADIGATVREVGGKTRVLSVCDREGDFSELFETQRKTPRVGLLVRAKPDRVLGEARPMRQKHGGHGASVHLGRRDIDLATS